MDRPPLISVVIPCYNQGRFLREALDSVSAATARPVEMIVVDDGSTDDTGRRAARYPGVRLIQIPNGGLAAARNVGLADARGTIVAYTDADVRVEPDWLTYLVQPMLDPDIVGAGGPNVVPDDDPFVAQCVARAPGGPTHVLLDDRTAEHIPGCNMAFRRTALRAIGGFDPQFRVAGDDVDVCWRIRQQGWTIGFSPAATVWHHRRNSVRAYLKQQWGYGRAEALLEKKWPDKYNGPGHLTWKGRIYGRGRPYAIGQRGRIYNGIWGSAPFQSIYEPAPGLLQCLPQMPEWYLVIAVLPALSALGLHWIPLTLALPLLAVAAGVPIVQAVASASRATFTSSTGSRLNKLGLTSLTALLHLLQPLARLAERLFHGLTPWRRRGRGVSVPQTRTWTIWSEHWQPPEKWLGDMEGALREGGATVVRGGSGLYYADIPAAALNWAQLPQKVAFISVEADGRPDFAVSPFNGPRPTFDQALERFCYVRNVPGCLYRDLGELPPYPEYAGVPLMWPSSIGFQRQLASSLSIAVTAMGYPSGPSPAITAVATLETREL